MNKDTKKNTVMKKYDLHIHSCYSPDSIMKPADILRIAKERGLNGIAITDHDTMKAYPVLKKLNKDKDFEIIPGEEIHTNYGHFIGLYLHKEIKSRDFFTALDEIHSQGGIAIIPHPFTIASVHNFRYPLGKLKGKVDAIEAFNSRNFRRHNDLAKKEILKYGFSQVGSSDSHLKSDIGNGYTLFEGDLRKAIRDKKTQVDGTTKHSLVSNICASFRGQIIYPIFGSRMSRTLSKAKK